MSEQLDQTKRVDDETFKVVESVLMDIYPPTNPAVLLAAARTWYLTHGSGPVLRVMVDRLVQVTYLRHISEMPENADQNEQAEIEFGQATGVKPRKLEERI
jgi:hypothetical protein